jgi:ribosomal protein L37AE/L43A
MKDITLREVKKRIAGLDRDTQKAMVCALVGHSLVSRYCFGYINCARCDAQTADTLMMGAVGTKRVIVGHNCETCQANYKAMDWRDKFLVDVDPFA